MKKSIGPKTVLFTHPVLLIGTYDEDGVPNIMTAAWGGICCSEPPMVAVSLREATHSHASIINSGAFTVNIPSARYVRHADLAGLVSGRDFDKFDRLGLTAVRSTLVNAPYVEEFPAVLECRLFKYEKLGLHTQFIGQIMDFKADTETLDAEGFPDIRKVDPFVFGSFGNAEYFRLGDAIGKAFSCGKDL
ncbi:MAG: flavin reductase family protein [Elusimicrobiaceae bacterium]